MHLNYEIDFTKGHQEKIYWTIKKKKTYDIWKKITKKCYFDKISSYVFDDNKVLGNQVKPFLTSKAFLTIENTVNKHKNELITKESVRNAECKSKDHITVRKFIERYKNHSSVEAIGRLKTKREKLDILIAATGIKK